jgi:hypothetical protein
MKCRAKLALGVWLMLESMAPAPAAAQTDVGGAWSMSYTTQDGVKLTSTLTLTVEGGKVSGTISSLRGSVPLTEGTVKGSEIAFAVVRVGFGDTIRIDYTGTVKGDTMKLKMKVGARPPIDVTVKRGLRTPTALVPAAPRRRSARSGIGRRYGRPRVARES